MAVMLMLLGASLALQCVQTWSAGAKARARKITLAREDHTRLIIIIMHKNLCRFFGAPAC